MLWFSLGFFLYSVHYGSLFLGHICNSLLEFELTYLSHCNRIRAIHPTKDQFLFSEQFLSVAEQSLGLFFVENVPIVDPNRPDTEGI